MAKKTQRQIIQLQCTECKRINYTTEKNKLNTPDKIELKKLCKWCKTQTVHKEYKKKK